MAHGRQLPKFEITDEEREVLLSFTRTHKTAQQLALRARIVLLCAGGSSNMAVAQKLVRLARPSAGGASALSKADWTASMTNNGPERRARSPIRRLTRWFG